MAETRYRQDPPTLEDLLLGVNGRTAPPVAVPSASEPARVDTPGVMSPQDRQRLIDVLLAPEDIGPGPQVDKPNALSLLFSGLGDAVNMFNASKSGMPGLRSDYMGQYQYRLDQQRAEQNAYHERKAAASRRSKERTANYLLTADERAQNVAAERQGRQDLKQMQIDQQKAQQAQLDAQFQQQKTWEAQKLQETQTFQEKLQKADNIVKESIARINGGIDKTQVRNDKKDLGEAITFIGQAALGAKKMLEGAPGVPPMSPDEIEKRVRITLDGLTLAPDARAAADAYFAKEVGPILHDYASKQQDESLAAGSPMADTSFNLTRWMKAHGW